MNPITNNIFFGGTSSTSAAKEEAPANKEEAHMANTPTLSPIGAISLRVWELHRWRGHEIEMRVGRLQLYNGH